MCSRTIVAAYIILLHCCCAANTTDVSVRLGDPVDLECLTNDGSDVAGLQFCNASICSEETQLFSYIITQSSIPNDYHNGKYSLDRDTLKITIHNVQINDERTYNCEVTGPLLPIENLYHVNVYEPPSKSLISTPDITADPLVIIEGDRVSIECRVNSVYPTDNLWFRLKSGASIKASLQAIADPGTSRVIATFSDVEIFVQYSRSGSRLYCQLYDTTASAELQHDIEYLDIIVPVCEQASILSDPSSGTSVLAGSSVSITCSAVCSPAQRLTLNRELDSGVAINPASGTASVTLTPEDNEVNFYCNIRGWSIDFRSSPVFFDVQFAPTVEVSHDCDDVNEGEDCTLTCLASLGNPTNLAYQWNFQQKFDHSNVQTLPDTITTLRLESVTSQSAGRYQCSVSNIAGTGRDDVTFNVSYAPQLVDFNNGIATLFGAPGAPLFAHIDVSSHPSPAVVPSWPGAFTARTVDSRSDDVTRINFSVTVRDETSYDLTIWNSGSGNHQLSRVIPVVIQPKGKPTAASEVIAVSVSHRQIIVSFKPGLDGGSSQTITCEIAESERNVFRQTNSTQYLLRSYAVGELIVASNLSAATTYHIRLQSDNQYEPGQAAVSNMTTIATKDLVRLAAESLRWRQSGSEVSLSWSGPEGFHTELLVEQCLDSANCTRHNVTGLTGQTVSSINGSRLALLVMQDRDEVLRADFLLQPVDEGSSSNLSVAPIVGGLLGGLVVIVLIAVVLILVMRRRHQQRSPKEKYRSNNTGRNTSTSDDPHIPNQAEPAADLYADVDWTTKIKKGGKKHNNGSNEPTDTQGAYANVAFTGKKGAPQAAVQDDGPLYGNTTPSSPNNPQTGDTELLYADLLFNRHKPGKAAANDVIHGADDDKVEYGVIDFTKKADPLPESDSDEEVPRQ